MTSLSCQYILPLYTKLMTSQMDDPNLKYNVVKTWYQKEVLKWLENPIFQLINFLLENCFEGEKNGSIGHDSAFFWFDDVSCISFFSPVSFDASNRIASFFNFFSQKKEKDFLIKASHDCSTSNILILSKIKCIHQMYSLCYVSRVCLPLISQIL